MLWRLLVLTVGVLSLWRVYEAMNAPPPTLAELGVREPVLLLETKNCGYCRLVRRGLDQARVPYVAWDVSADEQARATWHRLNARGVPVTLIGTQVVYGYDRDRLTAALAELGHRAEFP